MSDQVKLILIIALAVIAIILVLIIINNTRKSNLKKDVDDLHFRFNAIKTIPLAFKINKAQAIAKRNAETADKVKTYYEKYEEAQKHIDQISSLLEDLEDELSEKNFYNARAIIEEAKENLDQSEKEVDEIDKFLEKFSEEETILRDNSSKLKEKFRKEKLYINENANTLAISLGGVEKKVEAVEELFSQSEEFIYINDYTSSKETLKKIDDALNDIENSIISLPELVVDAKGAIPALLDETNRQFALARQRGVYTEHLNIDSEMEAIQKALNEDVKTLSEGNIGEVKEHLEVYKEKLNGLLNALNNENNYYVSLKAKSDEIANEINEIKSLHNYVEKAYQKDKERFGIEDIDTYLKDDTKATNDFQATYIAINGDIADNMRPASEIFKEIEELNERIKTNKDILTKYKATFDKNTTDEQRAKDQLMKLQVVLNEVEVKVLEYHLPAIADSYKDDLVKGREKVAKIKELLAEVPLNLELLNSTLDETIDFIFTFYNNVNNIVGMAIMVENAIVFGNKYRSSHPEVERDLSRAELSYLNGEYTKALTMSIACMEKLFPNRKSSTYLENI
ncbi:MAG: hypothetical protein IJH31_06350 [Erysipelotrichaceae bacterium]|nr:hypothetical protein [Erysipelotrichaceae bacterium]